MSRNRGFDRDQFNSFSSATPSWLEEFAVAWEKQAGTAVDAARKRQADSDYYSQIVSIVGGNKKHATVDSIVKEYQELTGLNKYLKTLAEKEDQKNNIKTAQLNSKNENQLFSVSEDYEDLLPSDLDERLKNKIKIFVKNKVDSNNGHTSIPAVQEGLLKSLKNEGIEPYHVYDPTMAKFIGSALEKYEKNNLSNNFDSELGKAVIEIEDDGSNKDFLHSLQNKNK